MSIDPTNIRVIFCEAVEKGTAAERTAYLDEACDGQPQVRAQVEELLALHEGAGGFLESPVFDPDVTLDAVRLTEGPGTTIDRYRLLEKIGEGGMAVVYLSEQEQPIRRRVAIKLIKLGMDTRQVMARFEAERQALALMDHPNIAKVFDGGATTVGRPYFVMEYVKGLPITEHCDREKLNIEERLSLFKQVCEGVQHAHQKGIIHRDIKPSNVLVYMEGNKAIPRIIDFGVAKALSQPLTDRTLVTEQGQFIGTPEYMSPEQAQMTGLDIDTRTDIYSLGVLLYELLTGALPFDSATLRSGGIEHIRRIIQEEEPKTPSTRLTSLGEQATLVAEHRCADVGMLAKRLHRELEWIPLKAMRKERARRYRSASELADDIDNYMQSAPLIAGPESTTYRVKKFVRRKRGLVTGVAAVLVVLLAGAVGITVFALQARQRQAEVQAVSGFLRGVLTSLDRFKVGGKTITERSVLDAAAESLEGEFKGTSVAAAEIQYMLGHAYWSLGLYQQSEAHFLCALEVQQTRYGPEHPVRGRTQYQLGWTYFSMGRYAQAEELILPAYETRRRLLGPGHEDTIYAAMGLIAVYNMQGRWREAEELARDTLETTQRVLGPEHWYVPGIANLLTWNYLLQGRYTEAEQVARQGLEVAARVLEERHWFRLLLLHTFASVCMCLGRYEEAEQNLLAVLEARRLGWGPEHSDTLLAMSHLAGLYMIQNRDTEAEQLYRTALVGQRRVPGNDHPDTLATIHGLALLCAKQGRFEEADTLFQEALERKERSLGEDHPFTLQTLNDFGRMRLGQGRHEDAETMLVAAVNGCLDKLGPAHPLTRGALDNLIRLYESWGKGDKVEKWRSQRAALSSTEGK
ncbi:MAG: tetratricopeptide repeat protein [Solirubrobacterales bacterium]